MTDIHYLTSGNILALICTALAVGAVIGGWCGYTLRALVATDAELTAFQSGVDTANAQAARDLREALDDTQLEPSETHTDEQALTTGAA